MDNPQRVGPQQPRGHRGAMRAMSDDIVWEVRRRYQDGDQIVPMSVEYHVAITTMRDAIFGRGAYKDV